MLTMVTMEEVAKETEKVINEYDNINTSAARWLKWNSDAHKQDLGITKIDNSNSCKWLFNIFNSYSVLTNNIYYTHNIFAFLYYYFIKKHKYIRFTLKKNNIFWIEAPQFISEIETLSDKTHITDKIYECYYRR